MSKHRQHFQGRLRTGHLTLRSGTGPMTYEMAAFKLIVPVLLIERLVRSGKIRANTAARTVDPADVHLYGQYARALTRQARKDRLRRVRHSRPN